MATIILRCHFGSNPFGSSQSTFVVKCIMGKHRGVRGKKHSHARSIFTDVARELEFTDDPIRAILLYDLGKKTHCFELSMKVPLANSRIGSWAYDESEIGHVRPPSIQGAEP